MKMGNKLEKIANTTAILLVAALGIVGFIVMYHTTESNVVTADIAKIQSQHKTRVIQEVALLTAEIRNLGKDVDEIRKILSKIEKKDSQPTGE